jgi:hypothetical protein
VSQTPSSPPPGFSYGLWLASIVVLAIGYLVLLLIMGFIIKWLVHW